VRWRGSFKAAVHDVRDDTLKIFSDLFRRYPDSLYALQPNPAVAAFIAVRVAAKLVRESVDLDCNGGRPAEEVQNERSEWVLSAELQTFGSQFEDPPESYFGRTHAFAKLARLMDSQFKNPTTMLRMVPLPAQSRGG